MGKRYYGIHTGSHDANVTILDEFGNLEYFLESERFLPREKKHCFLNNVQQIFPKPKREDIVCVHQQFWDPFDTESIEGQDAHLIRNFSPGGSSIEKFSNLVGYKINPTFVISHHLCHILSSWAFRENNELRFGLACDGAGAYAGGHNASCIGGFISEDGFRLQKIENIPSSGILIDLLGHQSVGKSMGCSGYFFEKKQIDNSLIADFIRATYLGQVGVDLWLPNFTKLEKPLDEKIYYFVGQIYNTVIDEIWSICKKNIENFIPEKKIGVVIGGGTHLALELNTKISKYTKDVVFGPPVNDSGISLGAAIYGYYIENGKWPPALRTPSIMHLQEPLPEVGEQEPKEISKLIANNKVIGLLRGKAECGPRSLGFRSILANAGKYENLKRVSQDLKGREYYRPLAPMVTAESFDKYFVGPKGAYMQYKCECTLAAQMECPAIVHKDNSSRPQVVYKEKDPWLHELLVEYGRITGSECLINTSLNGPGKPICNTYSDALEDFKDKDIELVSVGS